MWSCLCANTLRITLSNADILQNSDLEPMSKAHPFHRGKERRLEAVTRYYGRLQLAAFVSGHSKLKWNINKVRMNFYKKYTHSNISKGIYKTKNLSKYEKIRLELSVWNILYSGYYTVRVKERCFCVSKKR